MESGHNIAFFLPVKCHCNHTFVVKFVPTLHRKHHFHRQQSCGLFIVAILSKKCAFENVYELA